MRIRSLPEEERPLEKAMRQGIETLSNTELIGILLHTGNRETSALMLAEMVLASCDQGLYDLGSKGFEELTKIPGIGPGKAGTLLASVELGKRLASSRQPDRKTLHTASSVAGMFMERLRFEKREHFISVTVNAKGEVLSSGDISVGELTSTVVHPREVFTEAIRRSAVSVIFVHNHPSGDPTPSPEDIETTKRLISAGEILGIHVLDHIIIGDGTFTSLRAIGIFQ